MGRPSTAREALIEAAAGLFHERGYHAVGVSEICSRAGVQKGSFYHFFESKRALGLAVVEAYTQGLAEHVRQLGSGAGGPLERLVSFLEGVHRTHEDECAKGTVMLGCPLGNLALEMATHDEAMRDALRAGLRLQIDSFEELVRSARDRGEVAETIDPRSTARDLVALIEGQLLLAKLHNDAAPLAGLPEAALRLVGAEGV